MTDYSDVKQEISNFEYEYRMMEMQIYTQEQYKYKTLISSLPINEFRNNLANTGINVCRRYLLNMKEIKDENTISSSYYNTDYYVNYVDAHELHMYRHIYPIIIICCNIYNNIIIFNNHITSPDKKFQENKSEFIKNMKICIAEMTRQISADSPYIFFKNTEGERQINNIIEEFILKLTQFTTIIDTYKDLSLLNPKLCSRTENSQPITKNFAEILEGNPYDKVLLDNLEKNKNI